MKISLVASVLLSLSALGCTGAGEKTLADQGQALYQKNCAICHGSGGEGRPGLGKSLRANAFVHERGTEELVAFLAGGRDAMHPLNETGVTMPPRGGNPSLRDGDLAAIAAHLRTLEAP
jgi:mono/diheme cytochrome c family protein